MAITPEWRRNLNNLPPADPRGASPFKHPTCPGGPSATGDAVLRDTAESLGRVRSGLEETIDRDIVMEKCFGSFHRRISINKAHAAVLREDGWYAVLPDKL